MTDSIHGRFVWYDYLTNNIEGALTFYSHVMGWSTMPLGPGYTMWVASQGPLSGTAELQEYDRKRGAPPHWRANIQVTSADATISELKKLGGRVLSEAVDFPNVGRMAVVTDPHGATFNLMQPMQAHKIRDTSKEGEFGWHELMTEDHEKTFTFYGELFDWKKIREFDMGAMGKYLIFGFGDGDGEIGGMFTPQANTPRGWCFYVQTMNLDAALERAKSKDGRILTGPMEVPGGSRVAQLADPQGAMFALIEPKKA